MAEERKELLASLDAVEQLPDNSDCDPFANQDLLSNDLWLMDLLGAE